MRTNTRNQFIWLSFGKILAALLQACTFLLLANWIGPASFGILMAVVSIAVVPQVVADFGLSVHVLRQRAVDREDGTVTFALDLNNRISYGLGGVFLVALALMAAIVDPIFLNMLPLAVWIGADRNVDTWIGVAIADGRAQMDTAFLLGRRVGSLAIFVILANLGMNPILGYSIGVAACSLTAALVLQPILRRTLPPAKQLPVREMLRETWPYWVNSIATHSRNLDTTIALLIAGPTQAGFYAAASKVTGPLRILPSALGSVLLPTIARNGGVVSAGVWKGVAALSGLLAIVYAGIALAAPIFVPALLGPEFTGAVATMQIVCLGLILGGVGSLLTSLLQGRGKKVAVSYISIGTTVVALVGVALGSALAGGVGAAIGLGLSFTLQTLALFLMAVRS